MLVSFNDNTSSGYTQLKSGLNLLSVIDETPTGVKAWLESIYLGKFSQIFIDNGIDKNKLMQLTETDLKNMEIPKNFL